MTEPMKVTKADMDTASRHVADVQQQVQGELTRLKGELEGLSGHWVGISAAEFHRIMDQYDADATKLGQALTSISENIKRNGSQFEESAETHQEILRNAGSGLGGVRLNW